MRKVFVLLCALFFGVAVANAITVDWIVDGETYTQTTCTPGDNITPPTPPAKYGYTFRGWRGYTRIEYIETTGTQYIDTGYAPSQLTNLIIEITFQYTGFGSGESQNGAGKTGTAWLKAGVKSGKFGCQAGAAGTEVSFNSVDYAKHTIKLDAANETCAYDDQQLSLSIGSIGQITYPLLIGAMNLSGSVTQYSKAKYYGYKLYNDNTLVRDLIPVLDPDDIPCMYDKVSTTCLYNAGTGNFTAGPVI